MIVGPFVRKELTFTASVPHLPRKGDKYEDPHRSLWTVLYARKLNGPEPPSVLAEITMVPEHGVSMIRAGDALKPVFEQRNGQGWSGHVEHNEGIGFGEVRRLTADQLTYGGPHFSWLYRELGNEWFFSAGPHCTYRDAFSEAIFEEHAAFELGMFEHLARWDRIQAAIQRFQEAGAHGESRP